MRSEDKTVIAVVCSDIHLSAKPPLARRDEPDWYDAMRWAIRQVRAKALKYKCATLIAGDIFDHWKAPPRLINFALSEFKFWPGPIMAIPGQHDMPFHSMEDLQHSAYWTMVEAGLFHNVPPGGFNFSNESGPIFDVYGFGWGEPVTPPPTIADNRLQIAMVHSYVWMDTAHPDAPSTKHVGASAHAKLDVKKYAGYDAVIIGDNHRPWSACDTREVPSKDGKWREYVPASPYVFNCGGFMRRRSDDMHQPRIGLLHRDGTIESVPLETSQDVFHPMEIDLPDATPDGIITFIEELSELDPTDLDFHEELRRAMRREALTPEIERVLAEAMEHGRRK